MTKRENVFKNFIWRFMERCGAQGVTLIVSVVLARLLDPDVYGTLALVTVFITILQAFVDSGLGNALIQKKDADDLDFSSVFYFNMAVCLALYALMFFAAPLIAQFYERPELTPVVRVVSLTLIISGVKNIQQAYVSRNMLFKKFFFATLGGTIGAAALGIYLAYKGYGVWALVAQNLFNQTVDTIILWITVKWRPKWMFSWKRVKTMLSFGSKLLLVKLIDTGYNELRTLIIGKKYSAADLAFYNKGKQYPYMLTGNVNDAVDSVLFPTMAKEQNSPEKVKRMTRRAIMTSTYLVMPIMFGFAACATPVVRFFLTEKWLPCVPFMCLFCFTCGFLSLHTANINAIKAMGRSDIILRVETIKKLIGLTMILITMWISPFAMALGAVAASITNQVVSSWPNRKLLNYSYPEQLKDLLPSLLLAAAMAGIVYCVQLFGLPDWLTLLIQVPLGAAIYIGASKLLRLESFTYALDMAKGLFRKRKKQDKQPDRASEPDGQKGMNK